MRDVIAKNALATSVKEKSEKPDSLSYIVYSLFGVIEIFLIFRLVFKSTGVSAITTFVRFTYSVTQVFISPFAGFFPQTSTQGVEATGFFEPAILLALVAYALLAWGIIQLVGTLSVKLQ